MIMKLTQEQKRIKIAEACGWHSIDFKSALGPMGMIGPLRGFALLPDYFNDLNACYEMEKFLRDKENGLFGEYAMRVLLAVGKGKDGWIKAMSAGTEIRAEMFGHALYLWEADE